MQGKKFQAKIKIIGINPYVEVPKEILDILFVDAKREKGHIPVKGLLNGKPFIQTVVKYLGLWRLYLNMPMREVTRTKVDDTVDIEIEYDPKPRVTSLPPLFLSSLKKNKVAYEAFFKMPPSHQKEYARYIGNLKSEEAIKRNIDKVIAHFEGKKVEGILFYKRK